MQKLTGKTIVLVAAKHNLREIQAELGGTPGNAINPARSHLNRVLHGAGTAAGVADTAQVMMLNAGVKTLRKDAVRALEILITLPSGSAVDEARFFTDALRWTETSFGVPVLSAVVHLDEENPHCHVLLLPLLNGRMVGSDLMGNRAKLQAFQGDFHLKVGMPHGLIRQTAPKRLGATQRRAAIDSAFSVLKANSGLQSSLLRVLLEPHYNDPAPLLATLGIAMPAPKPKGSFVATMTRKVKTEKPIGFEESKPIGFADLGTPEKGQTLSCVGFANSPPPNSADSRCLQTTAETFHQINNQKQ
jgi:hypothetical protein